MKRRPINLALTTLKFPVSAIISILHRISGFILFLFIPVLLLLLACSLKSGEHFEKIVQCFSVFPAKLVIWFILSALIYHLFAGFRHVLMDFNVGESLKGARIGSYAVIILTAISVIAVGVWLW